MLALYGSEARPLKVITCNNKYAELPNSRKVLRRVLRKFFTNKVSSVDFVQVQGIFNAISEPWFNEYEPIRKGFAARCPTQVSSIKDDKLIPHETKTVTCRDCSPTCVPIQFTMPYLEKRCNCLGSKGLCYRLIFKKITFAYVVLKPA